MVKFKDKNIMIYLSKISAFCLALIIFLIPVLVLAEDPGGLVTCVDDCTFQDFINMLNEIMKFLVFTVAVPLAAVLIVYAGALMVIYASNQSKRDQGKKIIQTALLGLLLVLSSYLIISFILEVLTGDTDLLNNQIDPASSGHSEGEGEAE